MGCRPRCFNPSLPTRHTARFSLHQRREPRTPRLIEDPTSLTALSHTGEPIPDEDAGAGRATDPDLGIRTVPDSPDTRHETTDRKAPHESFLRGHSIVYGTLSK